MGSAFFRRHFWTVSFLCLTWHLPATGAEVLTANFDTLQEGTSAQVFSDGGLTFSGLDTRDDITPPGRFVVEWATGNLPSPFSAPNVLKAGGFVHGPNTAFGRFGSAWIDFDGAGLSAGLDVFGLLPSHDGAPDYSQNTLFLEAWQGPNLVTSSFVSFTSGISHRHLSVVSTGSFDRLRLNASGPVEDGVLFFVFDNVTVTLVPEPTAGLLLSLMFASIGFFVIQNRRRSAQQ